MELTRTHISSLAKKLNAETGMGHAKAIAFIAKSWGYADGNALMATLKKDDSADKPQGIVVQSVPADKAAGYLYTLTFPFISDDPNLGALSLQEIAYEVTDGGSVGAWGEDYSITRTPVDKTTLGTLATRFGSTPDFFGDLDDIDDTPLPAGLLALKQGGSAHGDAVADLLSEARTWLETLDSTTMTSEAFANAQQALQDAEEWYNDEGNDERALDSLRDFLACV